MSSSVGHEALKAEDNVADQPGRLRHDSVTCVVRADMAAASAPVASKTSWPRNSGDAVIAVPALERTNVSEKPM